MKIINVKTTDLIPYVNNARVHNEVQVARIASSIKEFGFNNPILLDGDKGVIAGHGRLQAAQKLGLDTVPCIELKHLSAYQKRAYIIADNKTSDLATWDNEILSLELADLANGDTDLSDLGFDQKELEKLIPATTEGLTDADDVPEPPVEPTCKLGDIWHLGRHRLMCGDCTDSDTVNKLMCGEKVDMIFADPPYGVSYASKNEFLNDQDEGHRIQVEIKNDHLTLDETGVLWANTFKNWTDRLAEYSCYYIATSHMGDLFFMMMLMMNNNGFPIKHCLIWNKNNHVLGRCDYMYKHEPILYGWKNKHKFYKNGSQNKSVIDIDKPLKNDLHPTMKPVELVENFILNSTLENMLVSDPFLGSGTTLIACEKTNRTCYGLELDPHYCDVIINRWEQFTGKTATLATDS